MTAFAPALGSTEPRAFSRSSSARVRPPRPRAPSWRKSRRETLEPQMVSMGGTSFDSRGRSFADAPQPLGRPHVHPFVLEHQRAAEGFERGAGQLLVLAAGREHDGGAVVAA